MTRSPRIDMEETPEGRIAEAAYEIMTLRLNALPHAEMTDRADFRDGLRLFVWRELLMVQVDEARLWGKFQRVRDLLSQLDQINEDIAKNGTAK